jgi:hypothetical protein
MVLLANPFAQTLAQIAQLARAKQQHGSFSRVGKRSQESFLGLSDSVPW